jgi:hypothetical protein
MSIESRLRDGAMCQNHLKSTSEVRGHALPTIHLLVELLDSNLMAYGYCGVP